MFQKCYESAFSILSSKAQMTRQASVDSEDRRKANYMYIKSAVQRAKDPASCTQHVCGRMM
jgi:hypothetical protein